MQRQPFHVDRGDDGVAYAYFNIGLNFIEAKAACEEGNARLALIETLDAKERIFSFLRTQGYSYWWIGLSSTDGTWKWLDGDELDPNVIDFAGEETGIGCGTLYQPQPGVTPSLYDYACDRHERSYICESYLDSLNTSEPSAPLAPGVIAAIAIAVALLIALISILIFVKVRKRLRKSIEGRRAQELPNAQDQQKRIEKGRQSSRERNDDLHYATIDDDGGYATIDTIVYSEVIDDAYFSDVTAVGSDDGGSIPGTDVVYASVNKEQKISRVNLESTI